MRLTRPRLLPATIAAMSALLLVKTLIVVQAVAEEAAPAGKAGDAASTPPASSPPAVAPVTPVSSDPSLGQTPGAAQVHALPSKAADAAPAVPPGSGAPEPPAVSEAERAVLLDLRQRREVLEARARELDERQAEMEAADKRLGDRVQQLAALQTRLESLEASRAQHKAENWAGLVKVYESMKPRDAAAIFDALDMQVLLQVLDRMQERKMAPVLAAMQPDRARLATQLLAEMRTRAITPPAPPPDPKG